jgi:very-short-patch-repair endonuclease
LWKRIRARQLGGFKFVCQEPIDRYYVDFVCRERRLILEPSPKPSELGERHLGALRRDVPP